MSKSFQEALMKGRVPSLSPHTSLKLLEIVQALESPIACEGNRVVKLELNAFREALLSVSKYAAIHQSAVVERFGKIIKGGG